MQKFFSVINRLFSLTSAAEMPAEGEPRKFPAIGLVFGPYNLFIDNSRRFFTVGGIYALIMTAVFTLLGQNLMCTFENNSLSELCSRDLTFYILSRLFGLWLISAFCVRIYGLCFKSIAFSWRYILRPCWTDAKVLLALIIFLMLNMLSLVSAWLLYIRIPNPDWRIELGYFTIVSVGFLIPLLLLRFYSLMAFIFTGSKLPSLLGIWKNSAGNGLRLLSSFMLLFCVLIFSLNSVVNNFRLVASENTIYITFVAEYIFNLVVLLNIMFFVNFCRLQKEFLFGKD